ncbi:AtzE family amidohydrolase [Acetobacter conturbans]|uniref:AtzE family amidohydrolase n=1 Tax=Acetobacter conturbans TaxID=1737472 RepID=A0ABX0JYE4_9PROT|nr:AtzE family amidohydrolase [Acetobacter conturbans]NHN87475.1 AtzE family amidohydrolase [Acetobacter conturbans]
MTQTAVALANTVRFGLRSAKEVVENTLNILQTRDQTYHCVTKLLADRALRMAETLDARIADGTPVGALAGVPFGVKDLFDIEGLVTTAGSVVLKNNPPAKHDAVVVQRLIAAGAIPVATLNMDEFAYGFSTENAHYGTTRNPRNPDCLAGGSSGGSAAAVAAGMLPFALGSDTNGSIRVPASLCGVWGLRPTQGLLPLTGVYPFVPSLDTVGPLAGTVTDLQRIFEAMQGHSLDEVDDVRGLRIAQLAGWFAQDVEPSILDGIDRIRAFFGKARQVELAEASRLRAAAFVISASEGGALHLPRLRARPMDYDPATRDRLMAGAILPASAFVQAHRLRSWFRNGLHDLFREVDVLIAPATVGAAPRIDQSTITIGGKKVSARANLGLFTQPLSLGGMPILSMPLPPVTTGPGAGMPLGLQLIAAPGRENVLFAVGKALAHAGLAGYPVMGATGDAG